MTSPEQQRLHDQLVARLEPAIVGVPAIDMLAASIAISLKRIADAMEQQNHSNGPPTIKRR